jgi:hypothetical protein
MEEEFYVLICFTTKANRPVCLLPVWELLKTAVGRVL